MILNVIQRRLSRLSQLSSVLVVVLITTSAVAAEPLKPSLHELLSPSETLNGQMVTYQQTAGSATGISSGTLVYYTSADCVLGVSGTFVSINTSPTFAIPGSGFFGINPNAAYSIGSAGLLIADMTTIQSMKVAFVTSLTNPAAFTGSCSILAGAACCVAVSCSAITSQCTSALGTQAITLN